MKFHVVTLFPELFSSALASSLLGKAVAAERVRVEFVDPRDFTQDRHRTTDDTPYGGGEGMVMKPEPLVEAIESIAPEGERPYRILLTPQGQPLRQAHLVDLSQRQQVVLVCGRYEGFDERVRDFVDLEISLGDFVLNGGEVAALAIIDGVARLIPGVIGNAESLAFESHVDTLLEYPQYTRPRSFRGSEVPEVLLSGNHEEIRRWRRQQMLCRTQQRRPDLWRGFKPDEEDIQLLGEDHLPTAAVAAQAELASRTYVALLHHPVYDRTRKVVTSAITNLDLHDIARSSRTYNLAGYFVVTPLTSQQELARRIMEHWQTGYGASYNKRRGEALARMEVASDLEEVQAKIEAREGQRGTTVVTSAQDRPGQLSVEELIALIIPEKPMVLMLGTGWGLTEEMVQTADLALAPIKGPTSYNHLSVRSAAAILLDRFFGLRN